MTRNVIESDWQALEASVLLVRLQTEDESDAMYKMLYSITGAEAKEKKHRRLMKWLNIVFAVLFFAMGMYYLIK